jgi:hypothetical protein
MRAPLVFCLAGTTFALALALALACGGGGSAGTAGSAGTGGETGGDLGSATAKTISDTGVMREAEAAANPVIRSIGDCDAVSSAYPDAIAKLDEIESRVQTQAGRTSLQALRKQVTTAGEACGVR